MHVQDNLNALWVAIASTIAVGLSVILANPRRRLNQAFALTSLGVACWLGIYIAIRQRGDGDPVPLLRGLFAVGAWFPFLVWWVGESAINPRVAWSHMLRGGKGWAILGAALTVIAISPWLIPPTSTPESPQVGMGMHVYALLAIAGWLTLFAGWRLRIKSFTGIRRVELQVIALGGASAGLASTVLTAIDHIPGFGPGPRLIPFVIAVFYAVAAWAIASKRIFGAKEIYVIVLLRALGIGAGAFLLSHWLAIAEDMLPQFAAITLAMAVLFAAVIFWKKLESAVLVMLDPGLRQLDRVQAEVVEAGRSRPEEDPLEVMSRIQKIISEWARAKVEISYIEDAESLGAIFGNHTNAVARLIENERGFTTDGLFRRARSPEAIALAEELDRRGISAVAFSGRKDAIPNLCLFLGRRPFDEPYRWPELHAAMHWAESIELLASHALLLRQSIEREKAAAAGMLGASIAHEIRNPLMAIKVGAELLPEWRDESFIREFSEIVQSEVGRIEALSEQLLQLATPKKAIIETLDLNEVITHCGRLLAPRFHKAGVTLRFEPNEDRTLARADRTGIIQVLFNLLLNAQQAVSTHRTTDGEVTVSVGVGGSECLIDVKDNGPGIQPERKKLLFRPFQSSKNSGFGLGLVVSARIVESCGGKLIAMESSNGAHFRIALPRPV